MNFQVTSCVIQYSKSDIKIRVPILHIMTMHTGEICKIKLNLKSKNSTYAYTMVLWVDNIITRTLLTQ